MNTIDQARETEFLGREFLTWLWFKGETEGGLFNLSEGITAELWVDGALTLTSDSDDRRETITCSGENPRLREARFALSEHKKVTQAKVRLILGDDTWIFTLDSMWMNFKSLKCPKLLRDQGEDPDGMFYEKMAVIEQPLAAVDTVYRTFLELRTSAQWEESELPAMESWIRGDHSTDAAK
jgi:hypothetical protein